MTAPTPAGKAQSEPKPLTQAQIDAGWHASFSTSNPYCPCTSGAFTKAVRWTEHAKRAEADAALTQAREHAERLAAALDILVKRIEFYSAMGADAQPNIEQWEYTEGSSDMATARAALAEYEGAKG
jgi:hypothetical protein